MKVLPFTDSLSEAWDAFCTHSEVATFLQTRAFLSYHENRFRDVSLLIVDEDESIVGVFPAAISPSDDSVVISHPGATYGGLVHKGRVGVSKVAAMLDAVLHWYGERGFATLIYKTTPSHVQKANSAIDKYLLWQRGKLIRCDLWNVISLGSSRSLSKGRKWGINRARKAGLQIARAQSPEEYREYYEILATNLRKKHDAAPVHSLEEFIHLSQKFPREISLHVIRDTDGAMCAGAWLFKLSPLCTHTQYIASTDTGRKLSALDFLLESQILDACEEGARWFSFGCSTEDDGRTVNEGLFNFKAEFGIGSAIQDFFEIDLNQRAADISSKRRAIISSPGVAPVIVKSHLGQPDMKKRILFSAAGTATAWHLISMAAERFNSEIEIYVCDTNPPYLIPASRLAHKFFQVPPIDSTNYQEHMRAILSEFRIDLLVPLIDDDINIFPADSPELRRLGVRSTAMSAASGTILCSKSRTYDFLNANGLSTPRLLTREELTARQSDLYFVKPDFGFGSRGARPCTGKEALRALQSDSTLLVQEILRAPEITVEVFNHDGVESMCRERIETKDGVCTKARAFFDDRMHELAKKICQVLEMPAAFCFQTMTNAQGERVITDLNPRLGAGTALSTACGWSLAAAVLTVWSESRRDPRQFLRPWEGDKYVVRVYRELVMEHGS